MKISAVVFDFGGVMTTSTMPQRVIALAKEKGIDWNVFVDGFNAHRLDYDAGHIRGPFRLGRDDCRVHEGGRRKLVLPQREDARVDEGA